MRKAVIAWLACCAACAPPPPTVLPPPTVAFPSAKPAVADASKPPAPDRPPAAGAIVPCAPAYLARTPGWLALHAIDDKVEALRADGDPSAIAAEIRALRTSPCMALAFEDNDVPLEWKTGLSLRTWWRGGGREWLEMYLMLGQGEQQPQRMIALMPSIGNVLTSDVAPNPLLAPILCPLHAVDDASCGAESAAWVHRANGSFGSRVRWQSTSSVEEGCVHPTRWKDDPPAPNVSPYVQFRTCLDSHADVSDALPLGAFRAPTDGWLFFHRGIFIAQQGCNQTLYAFDLATGSAYMRRCLPDHKGPRTEAGRVSTSALREAALMLVLANFTVPNQVTHAETFSVPAEVPIARLPGEKGKDRGRVTIGTSDMPELTWVWMRRRSPGGALEGQMNDWADTGSSGPAHANGLLRLVEASFQPGCAPAPFPTAVPWSKPGPTLTKHSSDKAELFVDYLAEAEGILAHYVASPASDHSGQTCTPIP